MCRARLKGKDPETSPPLNLELRIENLEKEVKNSRQKSPKEAILTACAIILISKTITYGFNHMHAILAYIASHR